MPQEQPKTASDLLPDRQEIIIAIGLLLVTVGAWSLVKQAALILPGVVLLWLTLPTRQPFVERAITSSPVDDSSNLRK